METRKCKCCGRELPITDFRKTKLGRVSTCEDCIAKNRLKKIDEKKRVESYEKDIEAARTARLQDFTPRELLCELKRRGYVGKLTFTEVREVNLSAL